MWESDIDLKLKNKIYLFHILFAAVLLIFAFFTYQSYKIQYDSDTQKYIEEKADFYKRQLLTSYYEAFYKFDKHKKLFKEIHAAALKKLQSNPSINLASLVKKLKEEFAIEKVNFHIYLINKN